MVYPILVMAAIIERNNKFLITQREKNMHNALRWEFPGGKVDFGEDPRYSLEREIKEELDIEIQAENIFELSSHVYDKEKHIVLLACLCKFKSGKIKNHGINDYKWVTPKEMIDYDITEADLPFVKKLIEMKENGKTKNKTCIF
ncbi:NUDIX domain-containing protein [Candidatus Pacearchaeota archaeon]|nr:NUDIX domain-containing protein [Candidatus Pacearchaeota archaeon]MBD3283255.1 NUDIX domain-containing protein [Candidatus Pacearchaeota archaeon]